MKIRNGFVSNSSSSSFIIEIASLNFTQEFLNKDRIQDVLDFARTQDWKCDVYKNYLLATTFMDNFDFIQYLESNYSMSYSNIILFGSYSGFYHDLEELKKFVNTFLYGGEVE